jgi:hypothetical protein
MVNHPDTEQAELIALARHIAETGDLSDDDFKWLQEYHRRRARRRSGEDAARHLSHDFQEDARLRMLEHSGFYL